MRQLEVFLGTSIGVLSTSALAGAATVWSQEAADVIGNVIVGYLDFRHEGKWRAARPKLVAWLDQFAKAVPAFEETRPKA